jgi:hypothetical protein
MESKKLSEDKTEKLVELALDFLTKEVKTQIDWYRKHGSYANQDRLIALAEKHVSELFEHRVEKAEAEGNEKEASVYDFMQSVLPVAVQILRSKKSAI